MKKLICALLALVMLVSLMPVSALAEKAEYETVTGTIMFNAGHDDMETNHPCPFTYSDAYFTDSGYTYRQDLATATMAMCLAAGNVAEPERYQEGPGNLIDFFNQIGFEDFECNSDFVERPDRNTFGVGIANKEIYVDGEKCTVIAIGLRGCGYYAEWAGDFNVGAEGEHTGFAICRDKALAFLQEYLAKHTEITGRIKIWCTGYSRGAAGANMLGGRLDDMLLAGQPIGENVTVCTDDMYIYTFEAPMGAESSRLGDSIYNNIHNIINYNDLVAKVAPACLGFGRYGVDHVMPSYKLDSNYDELKADMLEVFSTFENAGDYRIDNFKYITVTPGATISKIINIKQGNTMTQGEFLDILAEKLFTKVLTTREEVYAAQDDLQELILPIIGTYPDQYETAIKNLAKNCVMNLGEFIYVIENKSNEEIVVYAADMVLDAMRDAGITEYSAQQVKEMIAPLMTVVIKLAVLCPNEFATLLYNIIGIMSAHYGELGMAWMMTIPDDYMTSKQGNPLTVSMPYTDVNISEWFYDNVKYCYENGFMNGTDINAFNPNATVTRGQVVTVLYRMAGSPKVDGMTCPFTDIKGADYENAVIWGYNAGVVKGFEDNTFRADESVTREQLSTFIFRYANDGADTSCSLAAAFTDAGRVSKYARAAMNWCVDNNIIIGMGDGTLLPQGTATRAQLAAMVSRLAFC